MDQNHFVFHWTKTENLISILKDGTLYANKFLEPERKMCCGYEDSIFIFSTIYFDKVPDQNMSTGIILNKKVMQEECCIFNFGWVGEPTDKSVYMCPRDDENNKKIQTVVKYAEGVDDLMDQELLFIGRLNIKPYIDGVLLVGMPEKEKKEVFSILRKNYGKIDISYEESPEIMKMAMSKFSKKKSFDITEPTITKIKIN